MRKVIRVFSLLLVVSTPLWLAVCKKAKPPPAPAAIEETPANLNLPPPPSPPPSRPEVLPAILAFQFPTNNDGLRRGIGKDFYMFVDRYTNGVGQEVWQGGMYGFVRDPRMLRDGSIIYSRFHEGMDIAPARRNAAGEPLDEVCAMADGKVVYVNTSAGKSNYGNFVIVEHDTASGPFYSLYAHLSTVQVAPGLRLLGGAVVGVMGYTGSGINKRRAHVHVELNMVLNPLIAPWQSPSAFNGQNMVGIDVVGWLTVNARDPRSKLSDFILQSEPHWKLLVPNRTGELEIVRRHPWLRKPGSASESWEITFAANALPLAVSPSAEPTGPTRVVWVKPFIGEHRWVTREMLSGSGSSAGLTSHGAAFVKLITGDP